MLSSITHSTIPPGLAETVHRQTEGHPLFVQEVMRYLVEEGFLSRDEAGRLQRTGQRQHAAEEENLAGGESGNFHQQVVHT